MPLPRWAPILIVAVAFLAGATFERALDASNQRVRAEQLEDRFYDDCMFGPVQPAGADGVVPARPMRNAFAICYSELIKAHTVTSSTVVQQPPAPPAPPAPTTPPAPPRK